MLENTVFSKLELRHEFRVLKKVTGIGDMFASTIMFETGDINRFPPIGNYAHIADALKARA